MFPRGTVRTSVDLYSARMRPDPERDVVFWRSDDTHGMQVCAEYDNGGIALTTYASLDAYMHQMYGEHAGTVADIREAAEKAKALLGLPFTVV